MSTIIALDPGKHHTGMAIFRDGALRCAELIDRLWNVAVDQSLKHSRPLIIVERPEYQGARTNAARTQDTMALCWEGALLAGDLRGTTNGTLKEVTPTEWKGQMPKPVAHAHLWGALTVAERRLLGGVKTSDAIEAAVKKGASRRWPASYNPYPKAFGMHNVLDAVAIGCVELGRLSLLK